MSKSLGNSLLLADLLEKYSDEAIKFALLQTNYRNDINITDDLFPEAEKHMLDFYTALAAVDASGLTANDGGMSEMKRIDDEFNACMSDDFNTALALSNLFGYFKEMKKYLAAGDSKAAAMAKQIRETYALLGFFKKDAKSYVAERAVADDIPADVRAVAEERWAARTARDWAKSDELRATLAEMGYAVKDSKTGYELIKN
jgi:cysteinyl-tRNA synthetase